MPPKSTRSPRRAKKPPFIHPQALVETDKIGAGTRVWAFAQIQEGAVIGKDCNIGSTCFIEQGVVMGDRVTLKNGVSIWDGVEIGDGVFIGPNAVFTNDPRPRSKKYLSDYSRTLVLEGASIGANATLLSGITIGKFAMIGAGAVVTKDIGDYELVIGNPARLHEYVDRDGERLDFQNGIATSNGIEYRLKAGVVFSRKLSSLKKRTGK